jgi:UDPglucose 6-dehydrogenase
MTVVGVVGLGAVGGTVARAMSQAGLTVRGFDPYLGRSDPERLSNAEMVFVCVPTPPADDDLLDTTAVWKALREIEPHLVDGTVVAVKSTVPPGTSDALAEDFPRLRLASVPEFLVAAAPLETLVRPDRVVVGAKDHGTYVMIHDVLTRIAPDAPFVEVRPIEAELIKLASNAMLAAKVSLANELALVCEAFGVGWNEIKEGVGLDRRIGLDHLTVTTERGFGGKCLPKDLLGLVAASRRAGYDASILAAIASFNEKLRSRAPAHGERRGPENDAWSTVPGLATTGDLVPLSEG